MDKDKDKQDRYAIQSIEKALDVFEALSARDSLSLIELAELVNQPKSSLYRIILTLEKRGFIARSEEDGKYCLGYKQLVLTRNLLERSSLRNAAVTEMQRLVEKYGDTVNLCVLTDREILYVEIIEGTYALRMSDQVGSKSPFHATSAGKAIAAYLPEDRVDALLAERGLTRETPNTIVDERLFRRELAAIRARGYAVDNEEITQGARCVGAPVFDMFGHVAGAVSISGAVHRFPDDRLAEIAGSVVQAGQAISRKMGYLG